MPRVERDLVQLNFDIPGMRILPPEIGDARVAKKRRPKKNPNRVAVFRYINQDLGDGPKPDLNQLTSNQQKMYWAIMAGGRRKAVDYREQWEAERQGLTGEIFYLDQIVELEERFCGDCGNHLARSTVTQAFGRGQQAKKTQLLVNDYCPNCGAINEADKVWVNNSQIIKRE